MPKFLLRVRKLQMKKRLTTKEMPFAGKFVRNPVRDYIWVENDQIGKGYPVPDGTEYSPCEPIFLPGFCS
jgi:hypothetical protein